MPVIGRHKASQNADSSATHNLEVPGSSPGWSTNPRIKELEQSDSLFFSLKIGGRELVGNLEVMSKSNNNIQICRITNQFIIFWEEQH